jgi:ATP-dependent Clp protease ATP-binding subunit ClpA
MMTRRHRPDCRDKSCSGCSTQAETQRLKARIEELEREAKSLRQAKQHHRKLKKEVQAKEDELRICIEEGHNYGDEPECSRCGHYGPGDHEHQLRQRIEELEKQLSFIGDMAVTDWDDKVVGLVDAVVKKPPKTYAEWARDIMDTSNQRKRHTMALDRACEFVVEWLMNRLGAAFSAEEMIKYLEEVRAGEHDDFDYEAGASSLFGLERKDDGD